MEFSCNRDHTMNSIFTNDGDNIMEWESIENLNVQEMTFQSLVQNIDYENTDLQLINHALEYYEDKFLGRGSYGQVFEGKYNGKAVAVKRIAPRNLSQSDREIYIMRKLNHPNVIKLIHVENDRNRR